jgi:hypothetical protein
VIVTSSQNEISSWNMTNGGLIWSIEFEDTTGLYIQDNSVVVTNNHTVEQYKLYSARQVHSKKYENTVLGLFHTPGGTGEVLDIDADLEVQYSGKTAAETKRTSKLAGGVKVLASTVRTWDESTLTYWYGDRFKSEKLLPNEQVVEIFEKSNAVVV